MMKTLVLLVLLPANVLAFVARCSPLAVTCASRGPLRPYTPIMFGTRSAYDIFKGGLNNLARDPTGWFFGPSSALYSSENIAPVAPVMDDQLTTEQLNSKWLRAVNEERWTMAKAEGKSYAEESRQYRRTGKRLAVGFERSAERRDSFLAAASPQPRELDSCHRVCVCQSTCTTSG